MYGLWEDDWFQRALPALVVLQLVAIVVWLGASHYAASASATGISPAPAARADAAPQAPAEHRGQQAPAKAAKPQQRFAMRDTAGFVGAVRLGMRLPDVERLLREQFVTVQQQDAGSRRFEVLAPKAGLKLHGANNVVDTVTITNTGNGRRYVTGKGARIGDSEHSIARRYAYARLICGREWWVDRGRNSLRFSVTKGISSITLTSRSAPAFVPCA